jgi:hypothetical protein
MTSPDANEEFPPLNVLSLPANRRNLFVPSQFGSLASHEVAQSRLPSKYDLTFGVPDLRPKMEWSLVGGKGAISPFHIDSDGMGTVVVVAEGSKYWIVATKLGDQGIGPDWHPYAINDGDAINRFRFEAVHLQKGDMLWVSSINREIMLTILQDHATRRPALGPNHLKCNLPWPAFLLLLHHLPVCCGRRPLFLSGGLRHQ